MIWDCYLFVFQFVLSDPLISFFLFINIDILIFDHTKKAITPYFILYVPPPQFKVLNYLSSYVPA